jgi:phosphoribosylpyrophosphate synthetase
MKDLEIIEEIQRGNREVGLKILYKEFPKMKIKIISTGGTKEIAQEIFNDSLLLLVEKVEHPGFELTSKLTTYLFGIARLAPVISIQGDVKGKECLIVDDLADGGRTFKYLAEALKKQGASEVYLYVTHGQFNYGFDELKECIDHIYCTNSYKDIDNEFVTQYKVI